MKLMKIIMSIIYENDSNMLQIESKSTSYVLKILRIGHISHLYLVRKFNSNNFDYIIDKINRENYINNADNIKDFKLELIPKEYQNYGNTDLKVPNFQLQFTDESITKD